MKKLLVFIMGCISCAAFSLTLKSVKVFGEEVSKCNVSNNSADASISSAMRFNRVGLSNESKIYAYHQITVVEQVGGCVASVVFEINFNSFVAVPPENTKLVILKTLLCSQVDVLAGSKLDFGKRVNDSLKESVDLCINEISKK